MNKIITIAIALLLISCTPTGQIVVEEKVRIGVVAPLTGPFAWWGEYIKNAVELSLEDLEHNYEVYYEDSKCDTKQTTIVARKLMDVNNVHIFVGPGCVTGLKAIKPIVYSENSVMFSTGFADQDTKPCPLRLAITRDSANSRLL